MEPFSPAAQRRLASARARVLELADFHRSVEDHRSEAAALRCAARLAGSDIVLVLCAESLSVITIEGLTLVWAQSSDGEWRLPNTQFGFSR